MIVYGPIPASGFEIVYADPAWKFASNSAAKPGRNAISHYPCMKTPEICAMPVQEITAKDALCFLWATAPMLPDAMKVLDAWGFRYVSSFVWVKSRIGTGYWIRNRHEIVLLGKRGAFPCGRKAPFPTSIIPGAQGEHSVKPSWLQDQIDATWPDRPKVELFGRQWRLGWSAHGNEVPREDELRDGAGGTVIHHQPGRAGGVRRRSPQPAARVQAEASDTGRMGGDRPAAGGAGAEVISKSPEEWISASPDAIGDFSSIEGAETRGGQFPAIFEGSAS